jgi:hypothetical protein
MTRLLASLSEADIIRYAATMGRIAIEACREHRNEEATSERLTDRIAREVFASGPLDAWVAEVLDKYVEEPRIGADIAFILVDPTVPGGRFIKSAFVQAKIRSKLRGSQAVCELYGQCSLLNSTVPGGAWVWLYDDKGPGSLAASRVLDVVNVHSKGAACPVVPGTKGQRFAPRWNGSPMAVLRDPRPHGVPEHDPKTWFGRLLRCSVGTQATLAATREALVRLRPRIALIIANRDARDQVASIRADILGNQLRESHGDPQFPSG